MYCNIFLLSLTYTIMPLLHLQIKNAEQKITINQDIHAQQMRLRTVTVAYGTPTNAQESGILVDIDEMLGVGKEITSSAKRANQNLYLPRPGLVGGSNFYSLDLNVGLDVGHIPLEFQVRVYNDTDTKGTATFSESGVHEINLYFDYAEIRSTHSGS